MAQIEPISLAQNEPKRIGPMAKSGTDQTEMPGTITPKWMAQNEPKYPDTAVIVRKKMSLPGEVSKVTCSYMEKSAEVIVLTGNEPFEKWRSHE
ncbi:hypothetical protein BFP75_01075 [Maribacter sp. 4G9]|nr:hypothetical protein BFP75_01075 [Maribacter sp. 4G9]